MAKPNVQTFRYKIQAHVLMNTSILCLYTMSTQAWD